jgi:MFS family permease
MSSSQLKPPSLIQSWIVCITASLLFFYEFIQINIMNSLNPFLASDLHLSAMTISTISSVYFISNLVLLSVSGMLLDRFSTKLLITIAMIFCTLGTYLFGAAHSLSLFVLSRFFIGVGGAFCFLGAFRVATRWFEPAKLAQITGAITTMAMLGGLVGQQPAVYLINTVGWRDTLFIDAALGVVLTILVVLIVKDSPYPLRLAQERAHARKHTILESFKKVWLKGQIWLGAIYGCFLNLVIYVIAALWGLRFITDTYHYSTMTASHICGFILIGSIIGMPIIGVLNDYLSYKRTLMFGCAFATFLALLSMLVFQQNVLTLSIIFFCLGFFSSSQIMAYPHAAKQVESSFQASAASIVSICMLGSTALMQPFFAWLLVVGDSTVHPAQYHYTYAMSALVVCLGISVLLSFFIDIHQKKNKQLHR